MDRQLKRARIAHHEAAHAVVGRAVGLTVTKVRRYSVGLGPFDPELATEELQFLYAGMYADARLLTEHGYPRAKALRMAKPPAGHDLRAARSLVRSMRKHYKTRLNPKRAERDAARLVDRHWREITRMANRHL